MATIRECDQTKCSFHKSNGGGMFCPQCSECDAPSNTIDEDCVNCWNCLKDDGYVRTGLPKKLKEKVAQVIKEEFKDKVIVVERKDEI